ncbi:hypothetical protein [Vibrio parahaemolyticus]|uniref:hypothetical protein n=1 Tax=Vibrio parahaemolyticus TaxID=670 RepID=UPI0011405F66|nr:hypothetical protein [Vibrio parahaemolyticus]EGQ8511691.1 hypothetical protein [Vibrio parahaemolyticus]MDG2688760.1 hypothetical protein [Vibrio parahaemolyticus]QDG82169.1 hypothetical protein FKM99_00810 [Vibrio parahaemolyticus]
MDNIKWYQRDERDVMIEFGNDECMAFFFKDEEEAENFMKYFDELMTSEKNNEFIISEYNPER